MNNFPKIAFLFLLCVALLPAQQNTLTATTTSAALTQNAGVVSLTSATGVTAGKLLFIDKELMRVASISSTRATVVRGLNGTAQVAHVSGAPVLVGSPDMFYDSDPQGACTAASTYVTPYVNTLNGNQWLCSTVTLQWVPGFGNRSAPPQSTAAVASAAGLITPSGPQFHITGTAAITGFNIPVGFSDGQICVVPDAIFTTTNANNIALASTAVVNKTLCWTYDRATAKFTPSY